MLRHVVFFKFKDGVGEEGIVDLEKSLAELPPVIPEILTYEFGRDVVRSERSYDLALLSTFTEVSNPLQHDLVVGMFLVTLKGVKIFECGEQGQVV